MESYPISVWKYVSTNNAIRSNAPTTAFKCILLVLFASQGRAFRSSVIDLAVAEAKVPSASVYLTASFVCTSMLLTLYPFLFIFF